MTGAYTPGPWTYQFTAEGTAVIGADGRRIALVCTTPGRGDMDSDARLIAAAPEVAEALIAARHQLVAAFGVVRSHASGEHVQHYQRALMLCDAALSAAGVTL